MYRVDIYKCDTCIGSEYFLTKEDAEHYTVFEVEDGINCEIVYDPDEEESLFTWIVRITIWAFMILVVYLIVGCSDFIVNEKPVEQSDIKGTWVHSDIGWYQDIEVDSFDVVFDSYSSDQHAGYLYSNSFVKKMQYEYYNDTLEIKIDEYWHIWVRN